MAVAIRSTDTSIEPGAARELFQIALLGETSPFDLSSDGQRFVVIREEGDRVPAAITLIINWPAAVKKQ
jgi:hypothetical protein